MIVGRAVSIAPCGLTLAVEPAVMLVAVSAWGVELGNLGREAQFLEVAAASRPPLRATL